MSEELKKTIDAINTTLEARKAADEAARAEVKKHGEQLGETKEKLDKIQTELGRLDEIKTEVEKMAKLVSRPDFGKADKDDPHAELNKKHLDAFEKALRNRKDPDARDALTRAEREAIAAGAVKAVSVGSAAGGGYALPEMISREIGRLAVEMSPMRQLAKVVTVGTTDYKELVDILGASYGWIGETGTRSETTTPQLAEVAPSFGTIYAYPKATEESLNDLFFDVATWLRNAILEGFTLGEGIAFLTGNGSSKPTGLLNGSKVSTGDDDSPARAFGAIQYHATGVAADFAADRTASPPGNPGDVFINTVYSLRNRYHRNAAWQMNKNTLAKVRKFKGGDGEYLWQPGLSAGQPSQILGYPVLQNPDVASVGANAYPVIFGDMKEAYVICDLAGVRISVDDNITTPGYVKWYARKRVGGKLVKDEAVKLIKCATS